MILIIRLIFVTLVMILISCGESPLEEADRKQAEILKDDSGPVVVPVTPEYTNVDGIVEFGFDVQDEKNNVASVEVKIDDEAFIAAEIDEVIFVIDTNDLADGEHTITVIASDDLDNITEISFIYNILNTLPIAKELDMTTAIANESAITGKTFKQRGDIDGQTLQIKYGFTNNSDGDYIMTIEDISNHDVTLIYETLIRKNIARIETREEWRVKWIEPVELDSCACASTFAYQSNWELVSGFKQLNGPTIRPSMPRYTTPYTPYEIENSYIPVTATPWRGNSKQRGYTPPYTGLLCSVLPIADADISKYNTLFQNIVFPSGNKYLANLKPLDGRDLYACLGGNYNFFMRWAEYVDNMPGYPLTRARTTKIGKGFMTDAIDVANVTLNSVIMPDRGEYTIPARSVIEITKNVTLPILQHYNDKEVADKAAFISYVEKSLDKSITWAIRTDIVLYISVGGNVPSMHRQGFGTKEYTIAR